MLHGYLLCLYLRGGHARFNLAQQNGSQLDSFPSSTEFAEFSAPRCCQRQIVFFFFFDNNMEKGSNIKKFMIANNIKVWQVSGI